MQFMVRYRDRAGAGELRKQHRQAHTDYRRSLGANRLMSGPLLAEDCKTPVGSLLIIEAENLAAARAVATSDPFVTLGALELVELVPMEVRIVNPVPRGGRGE
jgi:uncharacterized protein YciI